MTTHNKTPYPRPWRIDRWKDAKNGACGIAILDRDGQVVANMVQDCFHDRHLANAKLIVEAVNQSAEAVA